MPTIIIPITSEGAVVKVLVGISQPRVLALRAAGQTAPQPIPLRLLVDTGADMTSIQGGLLAPLGIAPTGSIQMYTPSTAGTPVQCNQYDVGIVYHSAIPFSWPLAIVPIFECSSFMGTYQGLLGKDILNRCVLTYNSFGLTATISF